MFNTYVEENDQNTKSNYVNDNDSVQSIITKQDKVQRRLNRLKEGIKIRCLRNLRRTTILSTTASNV